MALHFDHESPAPSSAPSAPNDALAHEANEEAERGDAARASRATFERGFREELSHPVHRTIVDALASRRVVLFGMSTLAFIAVLVWEWSISEPIYAVVLPPAPLVPFLVATALAFIASACFSEAIPAFSLAIGSARKPAPSAVAGAIAHVYGRRIPRRPPSPRILWAIVGLIIATGGAVGLYLLSRKRVELQVITGESHGVIADFHVFLPTILFAIEVMLGMPTFFIIVAGYHWIRLERRRALRTRLLDQETIITRSAITKYVTYMNDYNVWISRNAGQPWLFIPPCRPLRDLLIAEFGYDPTRGNDPPPGAAVPRLDPVDPSPTSDEAASGGPREGRDDVHGERLFDLLDGQNRFV
jgi:hypothetical protein